ncbi:MAG: DegT/DnrJ/EryC1/StrS family aminotransferase [Acidobacteriota bacterium]
MPPIHVWGYLDELEAERGAIDAAIDTVLRSGRLILGQQVETFERRFAAYCGVEHGVGVNSGTDALFLAFKALGVGAGDEVITVSNTAVPTVAAIAATGARTRFVDIDPATYLMDVSQVAGEINERTKCVVPVHLFGQCVDMDQLAEALAGTEVKIVEDCAQAHGAEYRGRRAGSMSDLSAFSFYPTKILGGYGDGGLIATAEEALAARLRRLRFYGMEDRYYSIEHGYNSRLDELHAAILLTKLDHLESYIERRRELAARYDRLLAPLSGAPLSGAPMSGAPLSESGGLTLPATAPHNRHAYYLYVVRHPARDEILERLREREIFLNISYPWPIHTMTGYRELGYVEGDLPHTERAAKEIFSLPMFPALGDDDQERVCEALGEVLATL